MRAHSRIGEAGTEPALVAAPRGLPPSLYAAAVSRRVDPAPVARTLATWGAVARVVDGADRGVVGAAAAIAWPGRRATWEVLSYRPPERRGAPRRVDPASVLAAARRHPALFLCHDPATRRLLVAPHTDCPILFGLRSTRRDGLARARSEIVGEPVERWLLFRTNQGTGDHLVPRAIAELRPYDAARLRGTVAGPPRRRPGGHVAFPLDDARGDRIDCLAFEPTKTLPAIAAALVPGDRVEAWGGRGDDAGFRLEGIVVLRPVARRGRPIPPRCPACGRPARSRGRQRGYRCPGCRRRFPPEAARWEAPTIARGAYHPTPSARRHLHPRGPDDGAGPVPPPRLPRLYTARR